MYEASAKGNSATKALGAGLLALGTAFAAAAAAGTYAAVQLEKSMANVSTIWDEAQQRADGTFVSIGQATDAMRQLSTELPQSANNLAEGLYEIASSGFQGSEAIQVLTVSAKAASAGLTDTETAARGVTAVLNAYGDGASEASRISDILFQTVNYGVITFPELANVLGDFVGLTATAKVPFEEAGAALATMTLSGVTAAEAGTSLNRVMKTLIKPGEDLSAVLHSMGYESGIAAIEALGLQGTIDKLASVVGYDSVDAWTRLFPEIRATRGILALTANEGQNWNRVAAKMTDESNLIGAAQRALDKQSQSTSFQLTLLKNQVVALGIGFGQSLLPFIKPVVEILQDLTGVISELPDWLKTALAGATALVAAVALLGGAFLMLAPKITAAIALINSSATASMYAVGAMSALSAAMPVVAAIGVTAAIAAPFILKWGQAHADSKKNVDDLKKSLDAESGSITSNTTEVVRNRIVKEGLIAKAATFGITVETLTAAMLGDADAIAQVNKALDTHAQATDASTVALQDGQPHIVIRKDAEKDLRKEIAGTNEDLKDARQAWQVDASVKRGAADATSRVGAASAKAAAEQESMIESAQEEAAALKSLNKELVKLLDPMEAYNTGLDNLKASTSHARDDTQNTIDDWAEGLRRALEDTFLGRQRALDDRFDSENKALDRENDVHRRALQDRWEMEKDELAREERARRDSLDIRQRAEQEALDSELDMFDREFAKRQAVLKRQQQDEEDVLLAQIDQLFGNERQAAIDRLFQMKVDHADQLQAQEDAHDAETQTRKDALEDQQTQQDNAYDDEKKARSNALEERQETEDEAWKDEYDRRKTHLDDMKTLEQRALDDQKTQQSRAIDDQIAQRRNQHERERALAAEQRPLTLAEYQKTLDEQYKQYERHNVNMGIIATRGGVEMSSAVMAEIGKLPPQIVAAVATAGPTTFDTFMRSMKERADAADASVLGQPIVGLLSRIGELAGPKFAQNLITSLANDPNVATKLRDTLLALIAPVQTSPGVWQTPKPGGGYYPNKMTLTNAYGSITRQAAISSRPVLWAEAGPEAYIPLDFAKAGRSVDILSQAASFYGYGLTKMAAGGVLRAPGSLSANSGSTIDNRMNVEMNVSVTVAAGVDTDQVGAVVRREVGRALDSFGRQLTAAGGRR